MWYEREARQAKPKRTYTVEADEDQLDELERLFRMLNYCCSVGASRSFKVFADGDGSGNLHFKRTDTKDELKKPEDENWCDADEVHVSFGC